MKERGGGGGLKGRRIGSKVQHFLDSYTIVCRACEKKKEGWGDWGFETRAKLFHAHSITSNRPLFPSRPSPESSSPLFSTRLKFGFKPWNVSPFTIFCRIAAYSSSERPIPARGLIFPPSSSPGGGGGFAADTVSAWSNWLSDRGGIPTDRGSFESCWIVFRCVRCFYLLRYRST